MTAAATATVTVPKTKSKNSVSVLSQPEESLPFPRSELDKINSTLETLETADILQWASVSIPGLFQTTAFGLTGLVTLDIISKLYPDTHPIDLIFVDTLYHFNETLQLVEDVKTKYPNVKLHVYKPEGCETAADFETKYGEKLWERDETLYDYLVKVEPVNRAYKDFGVKAALTGRRKSQGGQRSSLKVIEYTDGGLIKINPLVNWTFQQVKEYVDQNNVPYNKLLDQGYRSVGDWHSTAPVKEGEDERAGRWKGKQKTECGIHENSRFAQYLKQQSQGIHT
ncbi:phosphoadenosine phosphosulfate reductase [Trichomonascus vanleenenianus]|uniref:phosphoadenylyl-sulfate reductase (thioredoxin) n=1 Tax=Trichomonascus vanleenenianus TaxID=2268995 RepID=UPI003ECB25A2